MIGSMERAIEILRGAGVDHLVATDVAALSAPEQRATLCLDLVVRPGTGMLERAADALRLLGFRDDAPGGTSVTLNSHRYPSLTITLHGDPPFDFDEAAARAHRYDLVLAVIFVLDEEDQARLCA